MFTYGADASNPLVFKALNRLMRGTTYQHLGKSVNKNGGEDNYIVPNITGDLSVPIYAEVFDKPNGSMVDRPVIHYGGVGISSHMGKTPLGRSVASNIQGEKFIFRSSQGVDIIVGKEGAKYKFFNRFRDKLADGMA